MSIILYTSPMCSWCATEREYLISRGVQFIEVNISQDRQGAMEMVRKSGQTAVPVIDINGNIVIGFSRRKIDGLLGKMYRYV